MKASLELRSTCLSLLTDAGDWKISICATLLSLSLSYGGRIGGGPGIRYWQLIDGGTSEQPERDNTQLN
jgi:hypothetical protein